MERQGHCETDRQTQPAADDEALIKIIFLQECVAVCVRRCMCVCVCICVCVCVVKWQKPSGRRCEKLSSSAGSVTRVQVRTGPSFPVATLQIFASSFGNAQNTFTTATRSTRAASSRAGLASRTRTRTRTRTPSPGTAPAPSTTYRTATAVAQLELLLLCPIFSVFISSPLLLLPLFPAFRPIPLLRCPC